MRIPIVYEIAGSRRCLVVDSGQKVMIGRSTICDVEINGEGLRDVEAGVKFLRDGKAVFVELLDGTQTESDLPYSIPLGDYELRLFQPASPSECLPSHLASSLAVEGVGHETRLVTSRDGKPILFGSHGLCDVIIPAVDCPLVQLALWPLPNDRVFVQVLDDATSVDWIGRGEKFESDLTLPVSLSISGKLIQLVVGCPATSSPKLTWAGARRVDSPALNMGAVEERLESTNSPDGEEYYVYSNRTKHGPFTESGFRALFMDGRFDAATMAWKSGLPAWVPINELLAISTQSSVGDQSWQTVSASDDHSQSHPTNGLFCPTPMDLGGSARNSAISELMGHQNQRTSPEAISNANVIASAVLNEADSKPTDYLPGESWLMKCKPTGYWKFILGANLFRRHQLESIERRGDVLIVQLLSGRQFTFKFGSFSATYITTSAGIRDFTIKSLTQPVQKVVFRETLLQMPEHWWNELQQNVGATKSGLSRVLDGLKEWVTR